VLLALVYRRFFERVGPVVPEFEAFCRARPVLFAVHGSALATVAQELGATFGKKAQVVATLGAWPWPNYALHVELVLRDNVLLGVCTRAEVMRVSHRPPALVERLQSLLARRSEVAIWLHPGVIFDHRRPNEPVGGWYLSQGGTAQKPALERVEERPEWLAISPTEADIAALSCAVPAE
jgi:hypothetical protein